MVNDLGNTDDLELMPTGGGYMVRPFNWTEVLYAPPGREKSATRPWCLNSRTGWGAFMRESSFRPGPSPRACGSRGGGPRRTRG